MNFIQSIKKTGNFWLKKASCHKFFVLAEIYSEVSAQILSFNTLLDDKDLGILRILQQNSRATVKEIAAQVHLSSSPVHDRIRRLEKEGIIMQYATLLNAALLGRKLMVICYVRLKEHSRGAGKSFIELILSMPEVMECYSISGEFDFMLKVLSADMDSYYHFHVNQLSQADNIGHVQSVFVMGVIKQTHGIL